MKQKLSSEEKTNFVKRYEKGENVKDLILEAKVSKSTFYNWIKLYKTRKSKSYTEYTAKEVLELRASNKKAKEMLEILSLVNCSQNSDLQIKLYEMEKISDKFSVHVLCEALNVARGTYYNHIKRNKRDKKDVYIRSEKLKKLICEIFNESDQIFGSRKIREILKTKGEIVSLRLIQELMVELDLKPVGLNSKKQYRKMILSQKRENVLDKNFTTKAPNLAWCSDFTEFKVDTLRLYVLIIIDLYSRKVIAYKVTPNPTTYTLTSTMKKALKERNPDTTKLIFHSDQGSQYTSFTFRKMLKELYITQSFSNKGTPTQNAVIEAFNGNLKKEELYRRYIKTEADFKKSVENYIEFYNNKRPHQTLGYRIPNEHEAEFFKNKKRKKKN